MKDNNRPFPIQRDKTGSPSSVPWWLAEIAYSYYVEKYGEQQSLKRLVERGGFGREELVKLLRRSE